MTYNWQCWYFFGSTTAKFFDSSPVWGKCTLSELCFDFNNDFIWRYWHPRSLPPPCKEPSPQHHSFLHSSPFSPIWTGLLLLQSISPWPGQCRSFCFRLLKWISGLFPVPSADGASASNWCPPLALSCPERQTDRNINICNYPAPPEFHWLLLECFSQNSLILQQLF